METHDKNLFFRRIFSTVLANLHSKTHQGSLDISANKCLSVVLTAERACDLEPGLITECAASVASRTAHAHQSRTRRHLLILRCYFAQFLIAQCIPSKCHRTSQRVRGTVRDFFRVSVTRIQLNVDAPMISAEQKIRGSLNNPVSTSKMKHVAKSLCVCTRTIRSNGPSLWIHRVQYYP